VRAHAVAVLRADEHQAAAQRVPVGASLGRWFGPALARPT